MNVHRGHITVTLMPTAPIRKVPSTAHAIRDTQEMESRVWVRLNISSCFSEQKASSSYEVCIK